MQVHFPESLVFYAYLRLSTTIHLKFRCIEFNRTSLLLEYILFCSLMCLKIK